MLETPFLGFTNTYSNTILHKNHIVLLFKIYVNSLENVTQLNVKKVDSIRNVTKVKYIEEGMAGNNGEKKRLCCIIKTGT